MDTLDKSFSVEYERKTFTATIENLWCFECGVWKATESDVCESSCETGNKRVVNYVTVVPHLNSYLIIHSVYSTFFHSRSSECFTSELGKAVYCSHHASSYHVSRQIALKHNADTIFLLRMRLNQALMMLFIGDENRSKSPQRTLAAIKQHSICKIWQRQMASSTLLLSAAQEVVMVHVKWHLKEEAGSWSAFKCACAITFST